LPLKVRPPQHFCSISKYFYHENPKQPKSNAPFGLFDFFVILPIYTKSEKCQAFRGATVLI
jgi:hypothetical protein